MNQVQKDLLNLLQLQWWDRIQVAILTERKETENGSNETNERGDVQWPEAWCPIRSIHNCSSSSSHSNIHLDCFDVFLDCFVFYLIFRSCFIIISMRWENVVLTNYWVFHKYYFVIQCRDLASLASTIIVKGIRREDQTIKLPFNINVLSTYNAITRLTDFIARTYTCLFWSQTGIVGGGYAPHLIT